MLAQARSCRPSLILLLLLTLTTLTLLSLTWLSLPTGSRSAPAWTSIPEFNLVTRSRRITIVSMLHGARNNLYERALQSHRRHAERWGYGMDVLEHEIAAGYWNKPSYLLSIVVRELTRPVAERVEWLMWVDADSIILNPAIPLEIFLPPSSPSSSTNEIHLIATKDHKGLDTGIFFLRVHQWSVKMLIEVMAYPLYNPSADLGAQTDQAAMEKVLTQDTYAANVTYLPRTWINTYEWAHGFEGARGNLLVHFPGLGEQQRSAHMSRWLDVVETGSEEWEVPVSETWYLNDAEAFWERVAEGRRIVAEYEGRQRAMAKTAAPMSAGVKDVETAVNELRKVLFEEPFEGELLRQRIEDWKVVPQRKSS
ncbi:hypothetical protein BJX70DRAFT_398542 [Aspergillus crustosus]